jgi:hypothetical protein
MRANSTRHRDPRPIASKVLRPSWKSGLRFGNHNPQQEVLEECRIVRGCYHGATTFVKSAANAIRQSSRRNPYLRHGFFAILKLSRSQAEHTFLLQWILLSPCERAMRRQLHFNGSTPSSKEIFVCFTHFSNTGGKERIINERSHHWYWRRRRRRSGQNR